MIEIGELRELADRLEKEATRLLRDAQLLRNTALEIEQRRARKPVRRPDKVEAPRHPGSGRYKRRHIGAIPEPILLSDQKDET